MKRFSVVTFTSIVAATILICCSPLVLAGWPASMSKEEKEKLEIFISENGDGFRADDLALFVKYKNKKGKRFAKLWAKNGKFDKHLPKLGVLTLRPNNSTALKALLKNRFIHYVEPIHNVHALPLREPMHTHQRREHSRRVEESVTYGIDMVQASSNLWNTKPEAKMTVCILDSGYGLGHPDLPNLSSNITGSSTGTGDWQIDEYGHGTHVAGIIGAIGENNQGVVGIMRDPTRFQFHIGKVLDNKGDGTESDLLAAFESCVNAGTNVISMSLGGKTGSETLRRACKNAYDDGILLVSASGNDGNNEYSYPASYPYVMSVAAVEKEMKVAQFSQYNDQVEIAGPGVDILSTVTTNSGQEFGYASWSGTSMATPYVAGVAALVWSYFPECTNNQIRNVLLRTAKSGDLECTDELGFGIVQAKAAYDLLKKDGCVAGGASPAPLSDGGIGGCYQDPLYVSPPTAAPTTFSCPAKVFLLELTTDEWAAETSWDLTDSNENIVGSGGDYRNSNFYVERLCLPPDEYTFTIRDSANDGICCNFGQGSYAIYFDGELKKEGTRFEAEDTVIFGRASETNTLSEEKHTELPSLSPTDNFTISCQDDNNWITTTRKGKKKSCAYLKLKPFTRCKWTGTDGYQEMTPGYVSCPVSCGTCQIDESPQLTSKSPTPSPTAALTPSPTRKPTVSPTPWPTMSPTQSPTAQPSDTPTSAPKLDLTAKPSKFPTPLPTAAPTRLPTRKPTVSPTPRPTMSPSQSPTAQPSNTPTSAPTLDPTAKPSKPPTPSPTAAPTHLPTTKPTVSPTPQPTPTPTIAPTLTPSAGVAAANVCQDDPNWMYKNPDKKWWAEKRCDYLSTSYRCGLMGKNGLGESTSGYESCPVTCGSCSPPTDPGSNTKCIARGEACTNDQNGCCGTDSCRASGASHKYWCEK